MIAIFPELVSYAAAGNIEQLAVLTRLYFGGLNGKKPFLDIDSLVADIGLNFMESSLSYHGVILFDDKKGSLGITLLTNQGIPYVEKRFLIAHMIGHFLFEVQPMLLQGTNKRQGFSESLSPLSRYEQNYYPSSMEPLDLQREKNADLFASSLLMPKGMIMKACAALKDYGKISSMFGVSEAAAQQRHHFLLQDKDHLHQRESLEVYKKSKESADKEQIKPLKVNKLKKTNIEKGNAGGEDKQSIKSKQNTQLKADLAPEGKRKSNKAVKQGSDGLKRLRKIAKRLDSSVEI